MKKNAKGIFVLCVAVLSLGGCGQSSSTDSGFFKNYVTACDSQWDKLHSDINQLVQIIDHQVIDKSSAISSAQQIANDVNDSSEAFASLAIPDNGSMQSIAQQIQNLDGQARHILQDFMIGLKDNNPYAYSDVGNKIIQEFKESLDVRDALVKLSKKYGIAWTPAH